MEGKAVLQEWDCISEGDYAKASGLGLYLCKGVCEKLGHEIRVVSEEGEGTTVILTLQLEKVQQRDLVNM